MNVDARLEEIRRIVMAAIEAARQAEYLQADALQRMAKLCLDAGLAPGYTFDLWGDGDIKRVDKTTDIPSSLVFTRLAPKES